MLLWLNWFSGPLAFFHAITDVYLQVPVFHFHEDNHDLIGPVSQHDHAGKNLANKKHVAYLADILCHKIDSTKNNIPKGLHFIIISLNAKYFTNLGIFDNVTQGNIFR